MAFHFPGKNNLDCKIQVKSKPTVINALNNWKSRYFFIVTQQISKRKYHSSWCLSRCHRFLFPMSPLVNKAVENRVSTQTAQFNFCTIPILRGCSSKSCGGFLILLFVALQFFCLVCLSKFYQFRKTEFPHTVFFIDCYLGSLLTKFQGNS